jgi:hypothetical protein
MNHPTEYAPPEPEALRVSPVEKMLREGHRPNEEVVKEVVLDLMGGFIPQAQYQELYPSETDAAIRMRIQNGHWIKGVHFGQPPGTRRWINVTAVKAWLSES